MTGLSVVLTGASAGIGEALAVRLGRRGDRLALLARRQDELERVAARARQAGAPDVRVFAVDVTDRAAVRGVLAEVEAAWQGIDLLILNAGIGESFHVEQFDDELAARTFDVNTTSTCYALGAVLPGMIARQRGHIVGVSSLAAYRGMPGASAYCASKAGLSTLLESLRLDLRRHGVAVTVVSPGFVRTAMTAKNRHPMPFLVEVDDAAAKIVRGIERRKREIRFPWPVAALARLLRALPDWLFYTLGSRYRRPPSKRRAER